MHVLHELVVADTGLHKSISFKRLSIWLNNLLETIDISSIVTSSASEYLFLSFALFASFSWKCLPRHHLCKAEHTISELVLITATPVRASNKTLGLAGSPLRYKNTVFTAWDTVLTKCDHGTIIQTGITCKKHFKYVKHFWNLAGVSEKM